MVLLPWLSRVAAGLLAPALVRGAHAILTRRAVGLEKDSPYGREEQIKTAEKTGVNATYVYDGNGLRVQKRVSSSAGIESTDYLWAGAEVFKEWLTAQIDEKRTEPNSGLGKAMKYLLTHWQALTLFLRKAGAPLDNNICERALKKTVLHRKNALFYLSENGAQVGDLYMSLVHTCELNDVNAFEYLVALQRNAAQVKTAPQAWMPWNFSANLPPPPS